MSRPRRRGRDVHGVLLLDQPQGASSNDVLQKVKRLFNAKRAGHPGALAPLAKIHETEVWSTCPPGGPRPAGFPGQAITPSILSPAADSLSPASVAGPKRC